MKKKVSTASMASILVASVTLMLGRDKETGDRNSLPKDEELTADLAAKFALSDKDVQSLVDDGKLIERQVRAAASSAPGSSAALTAANKRADSAEELVTSLRTELADADADFADLEKHVTVLEAQIKELGAEPTARVVAEAGEGEADPAKAAKAAGKA